MDLHNPGSFVSFVHHTLRETWRQSSHVLFYKKLWSVYNPATTAILVEFCFEWSLNRIIRNCGELPDSIVLDPP